MLQARPLLALPDGAVIAGNQRLLAARELGWQTIPAITVELDRERARLWAPRDNNPYGEWNEPALAELLAELAKGGLDLALSGFAGRELDRLLTGFQSPPNPDEAPALPEPESELGRIYQLGPHRLACGDARDCELLERLLADERPQVLWSDPPYGVDYAGKTKRALTIANDDEGALLEAALRWPLSESPAAIAGRPALDWDRPSSPTRPCRPSSAATRRSRPSSGSARARSSATGATSTGESGRANSIGKPPGRPPWAWSRSGWPGCVITTPSRAGRLGLLLTPGVGREVPLPRPGLIVGRTTGSATTLLGLVDVELSISLR
jgi:ParB-like chromosome segregation protein Spo0J